MCSHAQLHESRSYSQTWPWTAVETAAHLLQAVSWVCYVGIPHVSNILVKLQDPLVFLKLPRPEILDSWKKSQDRACHSHATRNRSGRKRTQVTEGQMNVGHMVRLHIACLNEYSAYRQLHSKCNQLAADANDAMDCTSDTKAC